jgi:hypothetical protein
MCIFKWLCFNTTTRVVPREIPLVPENGREGFLYPFFIYYNLYIIIKKRADKDRPYSNPPENENKHGRPVGETCGCLPEQNRITSQARRGDLRSPAHSFAGIS